MDTRTKGERENNGGFDDVVFRQQSSSFENGTKKGKNSVSILLIPFKRVYATILLSTVFVSCFHAYPVNGTCILKILVWLLVFLKPFFYFRWILFNTLSMMIFDHYYLLMYDNDAWQSFKHLCFIYRKTFLGLLSPFPTLKKQIYSQTLILSLIEQFGHLTNEHLLSLESLFFVFNHNNIIIFIIFILVIFHLSLGISLHIWCWPR